MFCRIRLLGVEPDEFSYGSVLSACCALRAPIFCKQDFLSNGYVQTRIMDLFSKNCNFKEALRFFYDASSNNVACWNAIISLAVKSGERWVALNLFRGMCHASLMPDSYTFPSNLTACCVLKELHIGRGVHGWAIKCGATDVFVETAIVDLYAKFGCMSEAFRQSSQMQVHNVVSWTAIISGFVQEDDIIFALKLFKNMRAIGQEINSYTMTSVLSACAKPGMIKEAGEIHSLVLKLGLNLDAKVGDALVNMYAKIGEVGLSELAFSEMKNIKDQSLWAAKLSSFTQNQNSERAVELFLTGKEIHGYAFQLGIGTDTVVGGALVNMYTKCGNLNLASAVFDMLPQKDVFACSSLVLGYAQKDLIEESFLLFHDMLD
uniref:Pentatricopeptide repeat-containing protein n=1 Tax=Glycine max TaxID=3847 RepID=A0A0R0J747_SOYBN